MSRVNGRRGFVLLTSLLCLLLISMLALTAASLALLARRTAASALSMARTDTMAEADPAPATLPIPMTPGQTLTLAGPAAVPGWSSTWTVTRLGSDILLVRSSVELTGPDGVPLARSALVRLLRCSDTLAPIPLPGGWLGTP